jgi:FkbM family methyltransferase
MARIDGTLVSRGAGGTFAEMDGVVFAMPALVRLLRRDGRDLVATRAERYWWEFEDPLPAAVATLLPALDGAFYDVGANTGFYSVLVGRLCPEVVVRAFEPVPEIADYFADNIALNRLRIEVERVALSDTDGSADLHLPPADHGLIESSASLNAAFKDQVASTIRVRCERLDAAQQRLGDERVSLIKIDVEGAEDLVLAGARDCLERSRPVVAVELLPLSRFDVVAEIMDSLDYRLLSLHPGLHVVEEPAPRFIASSWNQLLVPSERVEEVVGLLRGAAPLLHGGVPELTSRERLLWDQAIIERRAAALELEELRGRVMHAHAQATRAEDRAAQATHDVQGLRARLDEAEARTAHAEGRAADAEARAANAEAHVAELLSSTSWSVTAPLRRVSSMLRSP